MNMFDLAVNFAAGASGNPIAMAVAATSTLIGESKSVEAGMPAAFAILCRDVVNCTCCNQPKPRILMAKGKSKGICSSCESLDFAGRVAAYRKGYFSK